LSNTALAEAPLDKRQVVDQAVLIVYYIVHIRSFPSAVIEHRGMRYISTLVAIRRFRGHMRAIGFR
jgi:hypothetical protein